MSQVLNDVQASEFLGLRPQTLRNWRTARKGPPYVKLGGRIVYLVSDLEEYLNKRTIDPEGNEDRLRAKGG